MNKKLASFLLTEVSQWEKERIISSQQAQLLQQRYRTQATKHSQNLLQIILSVIGALLIGVGIVSILAFNWDNLPETLRMIIKYDIGPDLLEYIFYPGKHLYRHVRYRLPLRHYIEIIVRLYIEKVQNLIEHLAVLRGYAYDALQLTIMLYRFYERRHFYGLRPGSENRQYFFHQSNPSVPKQCL